MRLSDYTWQSYLVKDLNEVERGMHQQAISLFRSSQFQSSLSGQVLMAEIALNACVAALVTLVLAYVFIATS